MEKPGIKTTEFWVATLTPIVVPIVMVVLKKYNLPLDEATVTIAISSCIATPLTYILGRIYGKSKK